MNQKRDEHLSLICDINELANLVSDSKDIDSFLDQVVRMVAGHLNADVGSIYLYDESSDELILTATVGLNPHAVGKIRMKSDEGLVGYTMAKMVPIREGSATANPHFKYFESAGEERFNSFLAVPISLGKEKIGVLVVQHELRDYFNPNDGMALRAIASQLAGTIANVRLMMSDRQTPKSEDSQSVEDGQSVIERLRIVRAEATVPGFALAPAAMLHALDPPGIDNHDDGYKITLSDFQEAMRQTTGQLKMLQDQLVQRLPESADLIFEAHHMILKDPGFEGQIQTLIQQGITAPAAIRKVARYFIDLFQKSPNSYLREKSQDIEDLAQRLLFNLRLTPSPGQSPMESRIVIAAHLFPSDLLKLASEAVAGIIFVGGAVTSHVAIIARSLKIPMILSNNTAFLAIPEGTLVLMDAEMGTIYVDPSQPIQSQFHQRNRARIGAGRRGDSMRAQTRTRDGQRIELFANINLLSELELANELKAEGIGLYRSEFPFIVRSDFPSEEEQRVVYNRLIEKMAGKPVYIRTLDVGGDKILPYLNIPREDNPELGLRSIRFSLQHRDIFDQQLRAILRAGAIVEKLGIIFPMISSIDEFEAARHAVHEARAALEKEGLPCHRSPDIGAMVETPALVAIMDDLAARVDFLSIGSNDLVQYLLAVDRTNENVAAYYQPYHPAVLRTLAHIVKSGQRFNKPTSICGEVAHQKDYIPFLLGIGIRRLSVDPQFLPEVQQIIEQITLPAAQAYADKLLSAATLAEIEAVIESGGFKSF